MPFTFNFGGFNPGDFGQGGERPQRERKPRKPIGTPVTRTLINIAVTALVGLVYFMPSSSRTTSASWVTMSMTI